jgi:DNA-binding LacI/PurR family transcriptional regulator
LGDAGLRVIDGYVVAERKGDVETKQRGGEAMQQLLSLKPRPDGVFCFNDPLAMGAMNYALDQGIRIPEDIAVIGCEIFTMTIHSAFHSPASINIAGKLGRKLPESRFGF